MKALLDRILGWYPTRNMRGVFASGQAARNLAAFKSVACETRRDGCPHEGELFGCADCAEQPKVRDRAA